MEIPDHQCYCYAIMSSLCFPCQVKIHLLHLTAFPHGELMKHTNCPTTESTSHTLQSRTDPKDRSQTPQSTGKNSSQIPTSHTRENYAKTDCDKCYYYMNFINKLTSGLGEEKIMRMVCSNPCLISSDLPAAPEDRRNDFSPPKPGIDVQPLSHTMGTVFTYDANNATNQRNPSKMSARSNKSTGITAGKHPVPGLVMEETTAMVFVNNQSPSSNHASKGKMEINPQKKPSTPTNLMTTDKLLRKSFDSISKNRPSPISSRSPSPVSKHPEIEQTTRNVDNKQTRNYNAPKNDSKLAKSDFRTPTFQRNQPNSTLSKSPKNEPTVQRQMTGKEVGKRLVNNGRENVVPEKTKTMDASKGKAVPRNYPPPAKMTLKPPESAPVSSIGPRGHQVQFSTNERTMKTVEREKRQPSGAMNTEENKADGSTPSGGFFEAALVMEFYQPPQLGSSENPAATQSHKENEVSNKTKYHNQRESREQEGGEQQQTTYEPSVHYSIPEEHAVEYLPLVLDDMKRKNKKPTKSKSSNSSTKKEVGEDKVRKKSRTSDPNSLDLSSRRNPQVGNNLVDNETFQVNDAPGGGNYNNGRDWCEHEQGFKQTYLDNAGQRDENGRYPMYISTGRNTNSNDKKRDQIDHMKQIGEPESTRCELDTKGRLSVDESGTTPLSMGVVKKIREEIESEYRRKSADKQKHDPEQPPKPKKQVDKTPKPLIDAKQLGDDRSGKPGSPIHKKSRSSNHHQGSASGTSMDELTKVYPQFSEYMNPDVEGYRSKSAGNIVETHSVHDGIRPAKSRSERASSKWNCGACPDDKRVYYHTDSDGKCTSMVIGLPKDGRNSNPHIRINFNKQVNNETTYCKVDKCEQKNDYRDASTQCDYDVPETNSPAGSRPATARSNNNRISPKTSAKPLQSSGLMPSVQPTPTNGHQQMYYNRPLMRRSFQ